MLRPWAVSMLVLVSVTALGDPAPCNLYMGMQEREEVFEFAAKPRVTKRADGQWVVAFAARGKCDATVSILDKDGNIIRHLASGVLGVNAPHPFVQDTLAQEIAWDGLKDDFTRADPAGCKARVSLGLRAQFERNILWDPYETISVGKEKKLILGVTSRGETCVISTTERGDLGRVYDKDGKYLRSFFPPPAEKLEPLMGRLGYSLATTIWGDKTVVCSWIGPFVGAQGDTRALPFLEQHSDPVAAMKEMEGVAEATLGDRPAILPPPRFDPKAFKYARTPLVLAFEKCPRLTADPVREELYCRLGLRFDGRTGQLDPTWNIAGEDNLRVGPDGLVYVRSGNKGANIVRVTHEGEPAPFTQGALGTCPARSPWLHIPAGLSGKRGQCTFLMTGGLGQSQTWQCGFDVAEDGRILAVVSNARVDPADPKALPAMMDGNATRFKSAAAAGVAIERGVFFMIFDRDGRLLASQAVAGTGYAGGAFLDRDGNIYASFGRVFPVGSKDHDGIAAMPARYKTWGGYRLWAHAGTLFKFRASAKYPLGAMYHGGKVRGVPAATGQPSAQAMKLRELRTAADGVAWAHAGLTGQIPDSCGCAHVRFDLDGFARSWLPENHLCSVVVLDANGNRIARLGRYGNVDDTESDLKEGRDGLRLAWVRAVAASDHALYVHDQANRRIFKAAIAYAATEEAALP